VKLKEAFNELQIPLFSQTFANLSPIVCSFESRVLLFYHYHSKLYNMLGRLKEVGDRLVSLTTSVSLRFHVDMGKLERIEKY